MSPYPPDHLQGASWPHHLPSDVAAPVDAPQLAQFPNQQAFHQAVRWYCMRAVAQQQWKMVGWALSQLPSDERETTLKLLSTLTSSKGWKQPVETVIRLLSEEIRRGLQQQ